MYTDCSDSDDDHNECAGVEYAESQKLISVHKTTPMQNDTDFVDSQFLDHEIDEAGLKMYCLERIKLINEDMNDPSLTPTERIINKKNLSALNSILTNIRLSEKIKLGSLANSQYTDAIILQKQVVCNMAGQKEYGDLIQPVILNQPQNQILPAAPNESPTKADTKTTSIMKKTSRQNNEREAVLCE